MKRIQNVPFDLKPVSNPEFIYIETFYVVPPPMKKPTIILRENSLTRTIYKEPESSYLKRKPKIVGEIAQSSTINELPPPDGATVENIAFAEPYKNLKSTYMEYTVERQTNKINYCHEPFRNYYPLSLWILFLTVAFIFFQLLFYGLFLHNSEFIYKTISIVYQIFFIILFSKQQEKYLLVVQKMKQD
jgi:hypothetical protein